MRFNHEALAGVKTSRTLLPLAHPHPTGGPCDGNRRPECLGVLLGATGRRREHFHAPLCIKNGHRRNGPRMRKTPGNQGFQADGPGFEPGLDSRPEQFSRLPTGPTKPEVFDLLAPRLAPLECGTAEGVTDKATESGLDQRIIALLPTRSEAVKTAILALLIAAGETGS